jgi:hypothetical protein
MGYRYLFLAATGIMIMARDFTQPSTQWQPRWCRYLPAYELADREIAVQLFVVTRALSLLGIVQTFAALNLAQGQNVPLHLTQWEGANMAGA